MKVLLKAFLPVLLVYATYSVSYADEFDNDDDEGMISWYLGALTLYAFQEDFSDDQPPPGVPPRRPVTHLMTHLF